MHMHEKYSVIKVNAYKNKYQTSWIIIRAYLYAFTLFSDYDMVWDAVVLFSPGFAITIYMEIFWYQEITQFYINISWYQEYKFQIKKQEKMVQQRIKERYRHTP